MSKINFMVDNKFLNADLSVVAGTVDAQFPLNNMKHPFSTKVFRSVGNTVSVLIDLQTMTDVDIICLRGSSTEGLGFITATIEGSATTVFSGTPTAINVSHLHNFAFAKIDPQNKRYWKLVLTGATYVEISNIYIGKRTELADNYLAMGFQFSINTNSKVTKNTYMQRFIDQYNSYRTLKGNIKYCNATEFDLLNNIQMTVGENHPLWFMLDIDGDMTVSESEYLFSGFFYMKDLDWRNVAPGLYDVALNLEEAT